MRVYVPASTTILRELLETGALASVPLTAFAVTPALCELYDAGSEDEELEYLAMMDAARGSLRLLDSDQEAARRRVVVAVDVPEAQVIVPESPDASLVEVGAVVPIAAVAAIHIDDPDAEAAVAAAADAVIEADLGSQSAEQTVEDTEGYELSWYATQELGPLLQLL